MLNKKKYIYIGIPYFASEVAKIFELNIELSFMDVRLWPKLGQIRPK